MTGAHGNARTRVKPCLLLRGVDRGIVPPTPRGIFYLLCYNLLVALATELKRDFKKLADSGRLGHGYLLFGHESVLEKLGFARELANYLENKKWSPPERVLIDAQFTTTLEESGIDAMRSASQFLWQKPALSPRRTLVVDRADHLTLPAQNAILKISEEPPPHALIILLVKNPDVLLPALQSRFQKIYVHGETHNKKLDVKSAEIFLKSSQTKRKEMLKEIAAESQELENFVTGLIVELRRDKIKNWKTIKEILGRWTLMNQFNVNKKLQLEAAMINL